MSVLQVYCPPGGSDCKESVCNAGDVGSDPGSGRCPGEGNSYPLQYSCLENCVDTGARRAAVHRGRRVQEDCTTHGTLSGLLARLALGLTPFQAASQSAAYLPSYTRATSESKPCSRGSLHSHSVSYWFCLEFTFYPVDSLEFFCFVIYICLG